jgi:Ion channel
MTRDSRQVSGFRTGGFAALGNSYFRRRYTILFYSLLLTMVAGPASGALGLRPGLIEIFLGANLIAAIIPIGNRRLPLVAVLAIAVVVRLGSEWIDRATLSAASLMIWTILALLAAASALRFALRAQSIVREHVYAALSAYLLAGIFFGVLYWVLEQIRPGTFAVADEFSANSAIYFSFVTLATLGYGDIVPRTDVARGLATLEGVGGQLFLAVLIARLVSLYARGEPGTGS